MRTKLLRAGRWQLLTRGFGPLRNAEDQVSIPSQHKHCVLQQRMSCCFHFGTVLLPAVSWAKKVGRAGSCNFSTDIANFPHNSDRQLHISDKGDYVCSQFYFRLYISVKWGFPAPSFVSFCETKIFWQKEDLQTIFCESQILPPNRPHHLPWHHWSLCCVL